MAKLALREESLMKRIRQYVINLSLCIIMVLELAAPALAYTTPDFSDLPEEHWAYYEIMDMVEAGFLKGVGNGEFRPEMKVSVAQFLTLLGRVVFPDVKTEGTDWFGPYVTAAQDNGLLTGSLVNVSNVEAEINRYDMAVILRNVARYLDFRPEIASEDQIPDYSDIPVQYQDAVLAVCGMGLILGDEEGKFNGGSTMTRGETAVVVQRLWRINYELIAFYPDAVSAVPEGFISIEEARAAFAGKYTFRFFESQISVVATGEEPYCVAQWSVKDASRIVRYNWIFYLNEELMNQSIKEGEARRQGDG